MALAFGLRSSSITSFFFLAEPLQWDLVAMKLDNHFKMLIKKGKESSASNLSKEMKGCLKVSC